MKIANRVGAMIHPFEASVNSERSCFRATIANHSCSHVIMQQTQDHQILVWASDLREGTPEGSSVYRVKGLR